MSDELGDILDPYGGPKNNPGAIYMEFVFTTSFVDCLEDGALHKRGISNLSLARDWSDPRFDVPKLMGELIGLAVGSGADQHPNVQRAIDIARRELRLRFEERSL